MKYKYIDTKSSNKIDEDKYYTDDNLAEYCIGVARRILKKVLVDKKVSEVIEPSAGAGAFSKKIKNCMAYDISPESPEIIRADFLELNLEYKKDRLFITNPPFGSRMGLAIKFFKKCILLGDYIAFILPIGQLNNQNTLYEFDLIHSEDLGVQDFSGRKIHCCFNIYIRPENGLNSKIHHRLNDVTIIRQDNKNYSEYNFDIRMCYWGNGSAGKFLSDGENYSGEYKIIINNPKIKDKIISALRNANWKNELKNVAMIRISQKHIIDLLKREVPEIQ